MKHATLPGFQQLKAANLIAHYTGTAITKLTLGEFVCFNESNKSIIVYFVYCAKPSNLEAQLVTNESLNYLVESFEEPNENWAQYDLISDYIIVRTEAELAALHADALYRSSIVVFERDPGDALPKDKIRFALGSGNEKLRRLFCLLSEVSPLVQLGECYGDWHSFQEKAAEHSVAVIDENLLPSDAALGELPPGCRTVLLAKSVHTPDSEYDSDQVWELVDEQRLNAYMTPNATLQDLEGGIVAAALNGHYLNAQVSAWGLSARLLKRTPFCGNKKINRKAREAFSAYCLPGADPEALAEARASFRNRFWPEDNVAYSDLIAGD